MIKKPQQSKIDEQYQPKKSERLRERQKNNNVKPINLPMAITKKIQKPQIIQQKSQFVKYDKSKNSKKESQERYCGFKQIDTKDKQKASMKSFNSYKYFTGIINNMKKVTANIQKLFSLVESVSNEFKSQKISIVQEKQIVSQFIIVVIDALYKNLKDKQYTQEYQQLGDETERLVWVLITEMPGIHRFFQNNQKLKEQTTEMRFKFPYIFQAINTLQNKIINVIDIDKKKGFQIKISGIETNQKLQILLGHALSQYDNKTYGNGEAKQNILNIYCPMDKNIQVMPNEQLFKQQSNCSNQEESQTESYDFDMQSSIESQEIQLQYTETIKQWQMRQMFKYQSEFNMYNWTAIEKNKKLIDFTKDTTYGSQSKFPNFNFCKAQHLIQTDGVPMDILENEFSKDSEKILIIGQKTHTRQFGVISGSECDVFTNQQYGKVQILKQFKQNELNKIIDQISKVSWNEKLQALQNNAEKQKLLPKYF